MENKAQNLHLAELKRQMEDCFPVNPWIYWADLLASVSVGYGAFVLADHSPFLSWIQIFAFFTSVFALYRASLFIHELTHQERKDLPGFSFVWNLLVGIPMGVPSLMYRGVHIDHHKRNSYATEEDGEYLPFGASPFWKTALYLAQSLYLPMALWIRFGLIGPLSLFSRRLRLFTMKRLSSLAIRFDTERKLPNGTDLRHWYVQEFLCFVFLLGMFYLFAADILSLGTLGHIYLQTVVMFFINSVRTIVAHRYMHKDGTPMTFADQLLDSVNLEGNPVICELVAPVGLRYHGLHHLFPAIPYHNLGIVHRRLLETLPAGSFYHATIEPSLFAALRTHWKNTEAASMASGHKPA